MKIYNVYSTDDERSSSCKATCDSIETALEFAKTIYDWYSSTSVYEDAINEFNRTGSYGRRIQEVNVLSLKDVKINTKHKNKEFCILAMEHAKNNNDTIAYKEFKKRLIYLIENDIDND